jgi:endonuclease YncB( thermonuclease family)
MLPPRLARLPQYLLLALFLSCLFVPLSAQAWKGKVVGVTDGDTITVLQGKNAIKVRLYGIDCPEKRQAFGTRAKQFTSDLVFGKTVDVEAVDVDRYGRTVGVVSLPDGTVANREMVRTGFGWVYSRYCKKPICLEWKRLESEAATAKRGLWKDKNPVPPWEWRRQERSKR